MVPAHLCRSSIVFNFCTAGLRHGFWCLWFSSLQRVSSIGTGRAWFGMSKETGGEIMKLHSGEWMGVHVSVVYVFLIGGALLFLVCSGLWMWFSGHSKSARRKPHRVLAITFCFPLVLSAVTGMAYHAGGKWFQLDESTLEILMSLHQGTWLGKDLRAYYILLCGCALIALCLAGLRLCFRSKIVAGKQRI